eukprot:m.114214 g.114214  ORF g.114214 m.114214 type:complete len:355 (-) comp22918_c0_seq4:58-1122(-)
MRIRVVGLGANYHHQLQGPCHWVSVPELLCGWATLIALDHEPETVTVTQRGFDAFTTTLNIPARHCSITRTSTQTLLCCCETDDQSKVFSVNPNSSTLSHSLPFAARCFATALELLYWCKSSKADEPESLDSSNPPQLYTSSFATPGSPIPLHLPSPLLTITSISCGKQHVLLLTKDATVLSFGKNSHGQLGDDELAIKYEEPRFIEALSGLHMKEIAAGGWHSLALSCDGDVYSFGWNNHGQLGYPTDSKISPSPQPITFEHDSSGQEDPTSTVEDIMVAKIACGSAHSLALCEKGMVWAWGWNEHGQLGRPETECDSSTFPLQLKTPKNHTVRDVISGHSSWHSVLICEKVS